MLSKVLKSNFYCYVMFVALLKVYKFADVEETGKVDVATIITLAVQLMGPNFSEAEKESVCKKAEARAEKGISIM